jgi:hypothetical protein
MAISLAPLPPFDTGLLILQGEIRERMETLIDIGDVDLDDLERLLARANEYLVMVDSGRIAVCLDTKSKVLECYLACFHAVEQYKKDMRERAQEMKNEIDM